MDKETVKQAYMVLMNVLFLFPFMPLIIHLYSDTQAEAAATPAPPPPPPRKQRIVCVDPNWQEEVVMDGKIVFGVNPYREICTLHLAGNMLIDKVARSTTRSVPEPL